MKNKKIIDFDDFTENLEEGKRTNKEVPFEKSGLENPEKADINKNKKISGYEKARGSAIEKALKKSKKLK